MSGDFPSNKDYKPEKAKKDYKTRKRIIYKGKMAPKGGFFLEVSLNIKRTRYSLVRQFNRSLTNKQFNDFAAFMREEIREKYKV